MSHRRIIELMVLITLVTSVAATSAWGYGYSVLEDDIEFRVDYPVEMKIDTCSTVTFWMKAAQNLTDLLVVLTIYYHSDSSANPLYSNTIISEDSVEAGWTESKSIQICVPRATPKDPYVRAQLEISYELNGTDKELRYEWYMSIVRSKTYDELESEIADLKNTIKDLENQIEDLQSELDEKIESLQNLQGDYEELLTNYSSLLEKYQQLKSSFNALSEEYQQLEDEYQSLKDSHHATLVDLEKLKTKYELLMKDYGDLEEKYSSLLKDYETTLSELKSYKSLYLDLKSRHESLQSRHNELIAEVSSLRQRLSDLEEDYGALSKIYEATLGESNLTKNILFAQTAAVAAGLGAYAIMHKRYGRRGSESLESPKEGNGEKKVQKVLSGRRITIPSEVAAKLGLKEGDQVEVDYGDGEIIVRPVKEAAKASEEAGKHETREASSENN